MEKPQHQIMYCNFCNIVMKEESGYWKCEKCGKTTPYPENVRLSGNPKPLSGSSSTNDKPKSINFLQYIAYGFMILSVIGGLKLLDEVDSRNYFGNFLAIGIIVQGIVSGVLMLVFSHIATFLYEIKEKINK